NGRSTVRSKQHPAGKSILARSAAKRQADRRPTATAQRKVVSTVDTGRHNISCTSGSRADVQEKLGQVNSKANGDYIFRGSAFNINFYSENLDGARKK
ncbi:unnamed protein product, partial [Callosobruchus maculatus]